MQQAIAAIDVACDFLLNHSSAQTPGPLSNACPGLRRLRVLPQTQ